MNRQTRTYAEYRLFAALSQIIDASRVRKASLLLTRAERGRHRDAAICVVTVTLHSGEIARLKTSGDHPYAAINRAVQRLELNESLARHAPSPAPQAVNE